MECVISINPRSRHYHRISYLHFPDLFVIREPEMPLTEFWDRVDAEKQGFLLKLESISLGQTAFIEGELKKFREWVL